MAVGSASVSTRRLVVALSCGLLVGASLQPRIALSASDATDSGGPSRAHPEIWPKIEAPITRDEKIEARIRALLEAMTIEEKVGQVIQADQEKVTPEEARRYHLGSVLVGGDSEPGGRYDASPAAWLAIADRFHAASMDASDGGQAIPVLLGIDAVHGHNNVVGATIFPHNIALGAANDPALVRSIGEATALELRSTGFEWTFAPTLAVPRNDRWGRTYEGYSESPDLIARYAAAAVEGLQGVPGTATFLDSGHVLATAKHFIGDGGTANGRDTGNTRISEAELRDIHGAGYPPALKAGVQTVMASFSSWNGMKMHSNRSLLTDVLKTRMGFDGLVVGDWNAHGKVPGCTNEDCPAALVAGVDLIMAPDSWRGLYTTTVAQARDGTLPMARLDDAVARILRVKLRLGLFDAGLPSKRPHAGEFELLGSKEHRALARAAVRQSLVLLKNNGALLPLDPTKHVLVAGDGADDIGKQSGGWTLSWQGTKNKRADFPGAQSIWDGIRAAIEAAGGKATLAIDGSFETRPDVAIVVFGEEPYAETAGDRPNLAYKPGKDHDLRLLHRLKDAGIPVVAVFLSGRPLSVNREINASDAFVAAWLPGSEGGGVADVLFKSREGKVAHDFSGKLSYSWPRTAAQSPLNVGQPGYDPQFAFGYGLTYKTTTDLAALPEDSGPEQRGSDPGVFFVDGIFSPGWSIHVADGSAAGGPIDSLPSASPPFNVVVDALDRNAQEDARTIRWKGAGPARAWLHAAAPLDLRTSADSFLVATVRVDAAPKAAIDLGLLCGPGCAGRVAIQSLLQSATPGQWSRIAVPLSCFARAGADLGKVTDLFELGASATFALSVSKVALGRDYDHVLDCPAR
jgi:beta-glucosidase